MSRTKRRDPGGCWMRSPRHKRARVQAACLADPEIAGTVKLVKRTVKQPPDAWDDLFVSHWRGQEWARRPNAIR